MLDEVRKIIIIFGTRYGKVLSIEILFGNDAKLFRNNKRTSILKTEVFQVKLSK